MLKVLAVVDKAGTALDRLAQGLKPFMNGYEYEVIAVHPKRPDNLAEFEAKAQTADIIDYQYFRTAEMLREKFPYLKDKPSLLTHYNPYSLDGDWSGYDVVIGCNKEIADKLHAEYVPLTVDTDFWTYNQNWQANKSVLVVANRIESKKGILPVAQACKQLGLRFDLVGNISDHEYAHEVLRVTTVNFHQNISDEALRELYYHAGLVVCNSVDNFESGTLPILEAMLCGTPVLTRNIGHVPELNNGENMFIYGGEPDDIAALTEAIEQAFYDHHRTGKKDFEISGQLNSVRDKGWNTAKARSNEKRAYTIKRLYRQLMGENPVSVIIPIANRPDKARNTIIAAANQTHPNIELIVVDDGDNYGLIEKIRPLVDKPLVYLPNNQGDYGLARARNKGIIEATSDIVVFCDERVQMQPTAVEEFVKHIGYRCWLYGDKGFKKDFVENFSCCYRQELIEIGMFNERITEYGGMSQDIRARIRKNGWQTPYIDSAKASLQGKSSNRNQKRLEIIHSKNMLYKMGLD